MHWQEIRNAYPNQWLVIEALEAETAPDRQRILKRIAVIERCETGDAAFQRCQSLYGLHPDREYYFVHTSREALAIYERNWVGVRRNDATPVA